MKTLLATLIFAFAALAQAEGVYRCGNTYSGKPCGPDAKMLVAPPLRQVALQKLTDNPPDAGRIAFNQQACVDAVRRAMKDPDAARMGPGSRGGASLDYIEGRTVQVVTYFVNANGKNSYGGYTGEKLHMCSFDPTEKVMLRTKEIGDAVR